MKKSSLLNFIFYAVPLATILIWWTFAFKQYISNKPDTPHTSFKKEKKQPSVIQYLSFLKRDKLHKALSGDFNLMIRLITDWDHDAQIMEHFGFQDIKRLSKNDFLRCQLLSRQIHSSKDLTSYEMHLTTSYVEDDNGNLFDLSKSYRRFLPQSYVAASFLLALCKPESIVALPKGMREQKNIYPLEITNLIQLDIDRFNTEKMYEAKPEIAFVADYSHPSTIHALQKQGIPLFTLKHVNSPEDIQNALIKIGNVINRPVEAELLHYFVEAAMQAIDNRFKILNATFNLADSQPKVLFLKHYLTFSTPTSNILSGKLLKRIGVSHLIGDRLSKNQFAWTIPIHQEQILEIDPDYIIVSTNNIEASKKTILKEPVFDIIMRGQNKKIAFVNDGVQESPSQYIVLAYYDLFEALTSDLP